MRIETSYASPLVMKEMIITNGSFKRTEGSLDDVELGIHVSKKIEDLAANEYKVILELKVSDANEKLSVYVQGMAKFETAQTNRELIEKNTVAIMFPYLRSYVSLLTTHPGMSPIVLPAMNIAAMLRENP